MIEKSPDVKLYEQADLLTNEFRTAVADAQTRAKAAGVDYVFVVSGRRYTARPNGEIELQTNGE